MLKPCPICGLTFKNLGPHLFHCYKKKQKEDVRAEEYMDNLKRDFVPTKVEPLKEEPTIKDGWWPQPKQSIAIERYEFEILYGGARGGGKTDAGMAWMLHKVNYPRFRGLVIRLNAKDLNDWLDRARWMYRMSGADFKGSPTEIHFPSGAVIRTGHLKDEMAYTQYQGHEYQRMLIEELTQIPSEKYYEQLISSCRTTIEELTPKIFATTNPGGPGHLWVKERWNIPDQPDFEKIYKHSSESRIFIPAKIDDNPALLKVDPRYLDQLKSLKDASLRRSWLEGNWGNPIIEGAIYADEMRFLSDNGHIGDVPHDQRYPVYTYWDLGKGPHNAIIFIQNVGGQFRCIDSEESPMGGGLSKNIQILQAKGYFYGGHYAPHDIERFEWAEGESRRIIAQRMGINFITVPKMAVEDGINAVKMKLPLVYFDRNKCRKLIEALTHYQYEYDEDKRVFVKKPLGDWASHFADALRYWATAPDPTPFGANETDFNLYSHSYS
jgi:hypothetical protein